MVEKMKIRQITNKKMGKILMAFANGKITLQEAYNLTKEAELRAMVKKGTNSETKR